MSASSVVGVRNRCPSQGKTKMGNSREESKLEPGLQTLEHISGLTHITLHGASLEVPIEVFFQSDGLRDRWLWDDLDPVYTTPRIRDAEDKLERQLDKLIQQLFDAFERARSSVQRFTVCGLLVHATTRVTEEKRYTRRVVRANFQESWQLDSKGEWELYESIFEPIFVEVNAISGMLRSSEGAEEVSDRKRSYALMSRR